MTCDTKQNQVNETAHIKNTHHAEKPSPSLFFSSRFFPLFVVQFFGSFNDNAFKNAFLIWFTYEIMSFHGYTSSSMVSIAAGLFILPFFLFSATAGQVADKFEKAKLTQYIKFIEILLMLACGLLFYIKSVAGLLFLLFMMGVQSTFFGPIKYSLLPEQLHKDELILANGYIEGATFLSILLGTLLGGLIILSLYGVQILAIILIICALIGFWASLYIPKSKIADTNLKIGYNIYKEIGTIIGFAKKDHAVWISIKAISWFWLIGATFLTQLPVYTKEIIYGNEELVTLFLSIFSIGIGVGSILCNCLLKNEVSAKHVPYGSLGISMSIFLFVLSSYFYNDSLLAQTSVMQTNTQSIQDIAMYGVMEFFAQGFTSYLICLSLFALSLFAGVYIVPLYAIMQNNADERHISRIIAANNVMNALFMVFSSLICLIIFFLGFNVLDIFIFLATSNLAIFIHLKKRSFYA